ncbi:restriction endonuclease subunit S [Marinobacter salarius]|jgi:type I restriction enzyme, S subunit|uniref:restriction endonuclease subunit S n=1 Tax=Marinobacter salarius TaxID=1420917 RepID=UPI00241DC580|nr:restriction endonuclease subunit S [Marinobacter salarius]
MTFSKYVDMKESRLDWVGRVPSHWEIKPLFSIFEESRQSNKGMKSTNLLSLSYGNIVRKDIGTLDGLLPESFETYQVVKPNNIVFRLTDLQNDKRSLRSAIVKEEGIITSAYLTVVPKGIHARLASYLFRSYDLSKVFYSMGGGLRQGMKFSDIKRLPIILPPEAEQQKIAAFLDHETAKIDALIAEQQRLIELLKEKRQAVISHAVTKGLNPNAPMKDSGVESLGEVPAHWEVSRLRWYATIQGGLAKGKFYASEKETVELPYLRVANVQNGHFNLDTVHTVEIAKKEVDRYLLKQGDVLMNEGGDNDKLGRGAVWNTEIDPCLHQNHVFAIRPERGLSSDWLAVFTQSESARAYFYLHSKQSTNLASISSSNVMSCWIPIPPEDEQDQIMEVLKESSTKLEEMVLASQEGIRLLGERRSALISAAVTGKIDVRGWRPSESASPELVLQAAEEAASCG